MWDESKATENITWFWRRKKVEVSPLIPVGEMHSTKCGPNEKPITSARMGARAEMFRNQARFKDKENISESSEMRMYVEDASKRESGIIKDQSWVARIKYD